MPLYLSPPDKKHSTWRVRGTHLGQPIKDRSGFGSKALAKKELKQIEKLIKDKRYSSNEQTFASAAVSYMQAKQQAEYLEPIIEQIGDVPLLEITQSHIDAVAVKLYPHGKPSSRNRTVYTPVMAVMNHAGVMGVRTPDGGRKKLERPKGAFETGRTEWLRPLTPEQVTALLSAAKARSARLALKAEATPSQWRWQAQQFAVSADRFAVLLLFYVATGARRAEALRIRPEDVHLDDLEPYCICGKTKNGKPRAMHLPPLLVEELRRMPWGKERVFSMQRSGRLNGYLREVAEAAGVNIHPSIAFHIFRYTYANWMREYAGLDTSALVATGAWKSHSAARRYEGLKPAKEARKANLLPFGKAIA